MLAVLLDDADAVYPVRIDPTFSDANWIGMRRHARGPGKLGHQCREHQRRRHSQIRYASSHQQRAVLPSPPAVNRSRISFCKVSPLFLL